MEVTRVLYMSLEKEFIEVTTLNKFKNLWPGPRPFSKWSGLLLCDVIYAAAHYDEYIQLWFMIYLLQNFLLKKKNSINYTLYLF